MDGIDHIGIAVRSIAEAIPFYTDILKFNYLKTEIVESQGVKVAFIDAYNCKIELLEPLNLHSPIQKFLDKKGEGVHHIALKTTGIEEKLREMEASGMKLINEKPTQGAGGALVAFIHPISTNKVLYELCEKNNTRSN